tara:strand:+ start:434 stop:556 length:123 start_codon:yes stop_codon:yes gene_type:complete
MMTYQGGVVRGDMNRYKLLLIQGVKRDDKRWKDILIKLGT